MTNQPGPRPTRTQTPVDFLAGLTYPFRALSTINRRPGLWSYIIIPLVLNIVLGIAIYAGLLFGGLSAINNLITDLPAVLDAIVRIVLGLLLFVAVGFVLVRFGVVLGSPWYGKLSEQLETELTGQAPPAEPLNLRGITRDLGRSVLFEVKKLLLVIGIGLALFLLNLIPAVGAITTLIGGIMLGVTIACLDFLDPPLERRRLGFRVKLRTIRHSLPASAGFGLVCFGLISIPFINLLSIPLCITAGTIFFCDYIRLVE